MLALVGSFALLVTMHVAIAAGLTRKPPRWRGLLALLVPPLAPYWGMRERMRRRTSLWVVSLMVYIVARLAAAFERRARSNAGSASSSIRARRRQRVQALEAFGAQRSLTAARAPVGCPRVRPWHTRDTCRIRR